MERQLNLLEVLEYIDPASLNYQDWVNVGMALKQEGYTASDWDNWSKHDSRYHRGECFRKWESFRGNGTPVTGGTIVQMAKDQGWAPERDQGHELDWNDTIEKDLVVVDKNWIEGMEIAEPENWDPVKELVTYLETLFEASENVGYVTESWEKTDEKGTRWLPSKGAWDRTAGQLIESLNNCGGDIGKVVGDYKESAGAWIRFNPLDGNGCKNENVTDFRYALVESDNMELDKQNAIIRELELPVACLVYSGGKSLHAIVRVDAADYTEYRKRVDYLYNVCQKNGIKVDTQNRNPSRLSRMPGVIRNGKKQFIVDRNIGKQSWNEWYEWIEGINDDLPEPESMADVWDHLPELSEPLIDGILRKGHKMLIAGPSKAGKSFALIEMCIAIAEGRKWFHWPCTRGKVMYVNLELDRASCLHRFKDVYQALGWKPHNLNHIDIWNLRGKSVPMDKLAPKLIRRAAKKDYIAIVIDPIYKVITGDENSADQMAHFCNQFDKVCTELGCAVIYCHHHSKGGQGGKKSMDRASGSGVFARDPDALLDLIELEINENIQKQEENKAVCEACMNTLNQFYDDWEDDVSQDDLCSQVQIMAYCKKKLTVAQMDALNKAVEEAKAGIANMTAWRIDGTLREFPKFAPVDLWFKYPIHSVDCVGVLKEVQPEIEQYGRKKGAAEPPEVRKARKNKEDIEKLIKAFEACDMDGDGKVRMKELATYLSTTLNTVKTYVDKSEDFERENGMCIKVSEISN